MINVIDNFFDTDVFAEPAQYQVSPTSQFVTIPVIFTAAYQISVLAGIAFQNENPTAHCKTTDVAGAVPGSVIVIRGTTFYIREVKPDGTGVTRLTLEENSPTVT